MPDKDCNPNATSTSTRPPYDIFRANRPSFRITIFKSVKITKTTTFRTTVLPEFHLKRFGRNSVNFKVKLASNALVRDIITPSHIQSRTDEVFSTIPMPFSLISCFIFRYDRFRISVSVARIYSLFLPTLVDSYCNWERF